MKKMIWIAAVLAVIYLSALGFVFVRQENLVFFPETLAKDFPFRFRGSFDERELSLSSGKKVNYLVFTPSQKKGLILYFHGNAGSMTSWGSVANEISQRFGWQVWVVDYPGFGKSDGPLPANEKPLLETAEKLLEAAKKERGTLPLVVFGRSLGSGIGSHIAHDQNVHGLILETPYTSLRDRAMESYPIFPRFAVRYELDNVKALAKVTGKPVTIVHGDSDEVIPVTHSENLVLKYPDLKFFKVKKGRHNNLMEHTEYWKVLSEFFGKY